MKRLVAALAMVLTVGVVGTLSAQSLTSKDAPPPVVTAVPLVLGEVTDVTSHSVTVRTTRGELMKFETDSRTVMPMNLMIGRRVNVEFHLMENGSHHAGRITMIEPGSADWERYDQERSLAPQPTGSMEGSEQNERHEAMTSGTEGRSKHQAENRLESESTENATTTSGETREELPRTASHQPLLLGLGLAALALGIGIGVTRRRRHV